MLERETLRQLFVFGLVGVAATLTHYCTALAAHALGLSLYLANLAGYLAAVGVSFFGHGRLTFRAPLTRHALLRFAAVSWLAFLGSEGLLGLLSGPAGLTPRLALAVVVLSVPLFTFLLNKFWVWRPPAAL